MEKRRVVGWTVIVKETEMLPLGWVGFLTHLNIEVSKWKMSKRDSTPMEK